MMFFAFLLCVVVVSADSQPDQNRPGFDRDGFPMSRIVGGIEVNPQGKYPFMVFGRGCGGSLITPSHVMTAAHCVNAGNPGSNGPVYLGRHARTGGVATNVVAVAVHPTYGGPNESDIAIMTISPPMTNFSTVLLNVGNPIFDNPGVLNTVIGWGAIRENGPSATALQEVTLPVVSNAQCSSAVGTLYGTEICMGNTAGGQDACQGDSGGPMFWQDGAGNWVQTGVVSWGIGCARPNQFGVYARVSSAIDFILQNAPGAQIAKL